MSKGLFRIIGIKPLEPKLSELNKDDLVKVESIHKALWKQFDWHYFIQGFDIQDEQDLIVGNKNSVGTFSIYNSDSLHVTISAIVGKNGKGKSTIVDLIIRMINNLSAALMGEGYNFAVAEHLHFIDNVYASMAFQIGATIYVLEERGRVVVLKSYKRSNKSGYEFRLVNRQVILNDKNSSDVRITPLKKQKQGRRILKSLFYSMVCNYSLYGFNYIEYLKEATPHERIKAIDEKIGGTIDDENHSWLKGIFHKNDGYQTPIVLHPMRTNGKLDVNRENYLAKERLAALLFYEDARGNKPFRKINDLEVIAIGLKPAKSRRFSYDQMLETLAIGKTRNINKNFNNVYNLILDFWDKKYNILKEGLKRMYYEDACNYIVYKTLKIISTYKKYTPILHFLSKQYFDASLLPDKLRPLSEDYSHVTKKLLQTINYLRFDIYKPEQININLQRLDKDIVPYIKQIERSGKKKMLKATLLPPPIFDTNIWLSNSKHDLIVPFDRLSSGERQFTYTLSNFLYHLVNIDSAWSDYYHDKDHAEVIKYHYVNVIFDEVELYFHPDMQRRFVSSLIDSLNSVHFSGNLRGINIILATHSPFILSDIPSSNILCLGGEHSAVEESFAENIISLLSNGFFMSSTIGEYGKLQIEEIVNYYYSTKNCDLNIVEYEKVRQRFRYVSTIVGDEYLKDMVKRMMSVLESKFKSQKKSNV